MISEGQRNDINHAIPLLDQIEINGSNVLADRGYDSNKLLDYVYARGGEPTIPSRKGAKFERHCDWWLYKERHLVEKYFLKLKVIRPFIRYSGRRPSYIILSSPYTCAQLRIVLVHFFVASNVARYSAFNRAVSLGMQITFKRNANSATAELLFHF